jgi:hypothetical protein
MELKKMEKMVACCGLDCLLCPAYISTLKNDSKEIEKIAKEWSTESMNFIPEEIYCEGCTGEGRHFKWCMDCPIRACCNEKMIDNCAFCEDYICENLQNSLSRSPDAKLNLEEIRNTVK